MTAVIEPLGDGIPGLSRLGDLSMTPMVPHRSALALSYTVTPSKYSNALPLSYSVQITPSSSLLLYYLVTPLSQFAINDMSLVVRPDQIVYSPRPVMGHVVSGTPVIQGSVDMSWLYSTLSWSEWNQLISFYVPGSVMTLTFPDQTGTWVKRQATMHPPIYGTMTTVLITNASFSFSLLALP